LKKTAIKYIINGVLVLVLTVLAVVYLTRSEVVTAQSIAAIEWSDILIVFCANFLLVALLALIDFYVYRSFCKTMNYGKCLLNTISGRLGSSVTPLRAGHFPLKAYYQHGAGMPPFDTITGLVKCQVVYSFTSIIVYTAFVTALAVSGLTVTVNGITVYLFAVVSVGLAFNAAVFGAICLLSFCPPLARKFFVFLSWLAGKFNKSFDKAKFVAEKLERFAVYRAQIGEVARKFYAFIPPMLMYAAHMFGEGFLPYVAYLLLSGSPFEATGAFSFYALYLGATYISNVIPLPGAAGTTEVAFALVFASVLSDPMLGSTLVLWRAGTYYISIVIDLAAFAVATAVNTARRNNVAQNRL
jgi:uncharacterized membrane protein YbhN (UPF0104 family)